MSSNKHETLMIKTDVEGKQLVKEWGRITEGLLLDLKRIEELPGKDGDVFDKLKELAEIKEKYNLQYVPDEILRSIMKPELDKLKDVEIETNDDGLLLKSGCVHVQVKLRSWHEICLVCKNTIPYNFKDSYAEPLSPSKAAIVKQYRAYLNKEVGKIEFSRNVTRDLMALRTKANTVYHKARMLIEGYYFISLNKEALDKMIVLDDEAIAKMASKEETKVANKKRDEERDEVLIRTGLNLFIEKFRKNGFEVRSSGISNDFTEELHQEMEI